MKPRHLNCLAHFGDPPDGSINVRESVYMYLYKEKIAREHLTGPQHYPDNGLVSGTRGKVSRNQEEEAYSARGVDFHSSSTTFQSPSIVVSMRLKRHLFNGPNNPWVKRQGTSQEYVEKVYMEYLYQSSFFQRMQWYFSKHDSQLCLEEVSLFESHWDKEPEFLL
ncbi:hypothetical protein AVEN_181754-1 [Araneus ventricosus]|uniref:Uncharacterized protein n=1 Tax=Araneus ventricosus TaxID=182803 RepID=A0A4Y2UME1_ARAVE|nr:hypothetical protein AVEN_44202-1 [Araneus ventricosus]GBO13291.1 hypothetical protein AVEN_181754-1 [Araneus ventricosus]